MFNRQKPATPLDDELTRILNYLKTMEPSEKDYKRVLANYKELTDLKAHEAKWKISPDTVAIIAANLSGILLVLYAERTQIISRQAFTLVKKAW